MILKIAVPVPLRQCFDYLLPENTPPDDLRVGARVLVPFGRRKAVGFLVGWGEGDSEIPRSRLKPALTVLDRPSLLSEGDCEVLQWAARYYHHPLGEVFATAFPVLLRQGRSATCDRPQHLCLTAEGLQAAPDRRAPRQESLLARMREHAMGVPLRELDELDWDWRAPARALIKRGWACIQEVDFNIPLAGAETGGESPPCLNQEQERAVQAVSEDLGRFAAFLLEGVTGSGKTEVYLRLVAAVLARGQQVMLLLPEIGLTPQLVERFRRRFTAPIAVFHSGLNETERLRAWLSVQRGEAPILIGARSALFTPMARPGLIILDEEHDSSFKQQEGFRFSARDVAIMRARRLGIPVLLGSATPSLESVNNARIGRYGHLQLRRRAGTAEPPRFRLVDIRAQKLQEGLSPPLLAAIEETLAQNEQALLFINRRGFAPSLICHACGWVAGCRRCDAHLVLHAGEGKLCCHHCGHEQARPRACPACGVSDLRPLGLGTERLENALAQRFPAVKALRIDRDSTRRKGSLEHMLEEIHQRRASILIGTQMLAKGHHFPHVTLVAILDVDAGLYSADFRAGERTAQLIVQVAGRAGRAERPGSVILQTRHPQHPLLLSLIHQGYASFAEAALEERRAAALPPFGHQALFRAEATGADAARALLERVRELATASGSAVTVLGPAPAPLPRKAGRHRSQLLLQHVERGPLHGLIAHLLEKIGDLGESRQARWSLEVDPVDLY